MLRVSGMLGQRWHHIGLMFSHFMGILWFVLAFVGQELGPYWAYLGPLWAMLGHFGPCLEPYWAHLGPFWAIFWSVSAFVFGLGHFNVVEFSSMQGVCKNTQNTRKNTICGLRCWLFLLLFFLFLSWGICLISGLCWAIVGYVGHFVISCGLRLPLLSHFRGILWFVLAFVGQELGPY